jgi:hypothetical protein
MIALLISLIHIGIVCIKTKISFFMFMSTKKKKIAAEKLSDPIMRRHNYNSEQLPPGSENGSSP